MYRKMINFYINKNGDLSCIWYAERKGKWSSPNGDPRCGIWSKLNIADEHFAVRYVTLGYNCDKSGICKVAYCQTEKEAQDIIKQFVNTKMPRVKDIDNWCFYKLSICPKKYHDWFFEWIKYKTTKFEYNELITKFWRYLQEVNA